MTSKAKAKAKAETAKTTIRTCKRCKEQLVPEHTIVECNLKLQQLQQHQFVDGRLPAPDWMDCFASHYLKVRGWDEGKQRWEKQLCVADGFAFVHELRGTIMRLPMVERQMVLEQLSHTDSERVAKARNAFTTMLKTQVVPMRSPTNRDFVLDILKGVRS